MSAARPPDSRPCCKCGAAVAYNGKGRPRSYCDNCASAHLLWERGLPRRRENRRAKEHHIAARHITSTSTHCAPGWLLALLWAASQERPEGATTEDVVVGVLEAVHYGRIVVRFRHPAA